MCLSTTTQLSLLTLHWHNFCPEQHENRPIVIAVDKTNNLDCVTVLKLGMILGRTGSKVRSPGAADSLTAVTAR